MVWSNGCCELKPIQISPSGVEAASDIVDRLGGGLYEQLERSPPVRGDRDGETLYDDGRNGDRFDKSSGLVLDDAPARFSYIG